MQVYYLSLDIKFDSICLYLVIWKEILEQNKTGHMERDFGIKQNKLWSLVFLSHMA